MIKKQFGWGRISLQVCMWTHCWCFSMLHAWQLKCPFFQMWHQKHARSWHHCNGLCAYTWRDVHHLFKLDISFVHVHVYQIWASSRSEILLQIILATGFIAKNLEGQVTTLKRNGSDYSATILGALLRSCHITIWTDVDGVFSADPRKVSIFSLWLNSRGSVADISWGSGTKKGRMKLKLKPRFSCSQICNYSASCPEWKFLSIYQSIFESEDQ